jgi:hypothetical protein
LEHSGEEKGKKIKNNEWKIKELWDSIKRPNL